MKTKCLHPECEDSAANRGICLRHYGVAHYAVKSGKTTWETLESKGKTLPIAKYRTSAKKNWFIDAD